MATLKVDIISKQMIKPSSPTPNHRKSHKLSFVDQFAPTIYMPFIFFYQSPPLSRAGGGGVGGGSSDDYVQKSALLKRSLSETLTQFYPMAGKVEDNLWFNCNDQGVEYYEARVLSKLSDVIDKPNPDELVKLLPFAPESGNNSDILAGVQVNHFSCGSVAISVCISHKFADGATFVAFVNAWAAKACALKEAKIDHVPTISFDSATIFPPKDLSWFKDLEKLVSKEKIVTRIVVFGKEKLDTLRKQCISDDALLSRPPSRVELVSAFLWNKFIDVSKSSKPNPPEIVYASQAINLRTMTSSSSSPVPDNCYGNLFWLTYANAVVKEDVKYPKLVARLRAAVQQIDQSYLQKFENGDCLLDIKKTNQSSIEGVAVCCGFSSCTSFPLYEANFGWGKPIWVSMAAVPLKNSVFFLNTKCGKGIEAWINLPEQDVSMLEEDTNNNPIFGTRHKIAARL